MSPTCDDERITPAVTLEHAKDQSNSSFFGRLPPEIRTQIYEHIVQPVQHIFMWDAHHTGPMAHAPCIVDPEAQDMRERTYFHALKYDELPDGTPATDDDKIAWDARQYTDWCNHWQCEEACIWGEAIGPLLACKQMHAEYIGMLYSRTTFSFINTAALDRFLNQTPAQYLELIQSIHVIWRGQGTWALIREEHLQDPDLRGHGPDATAHRHLHVWSDLWKRLLKRCKRLSNVRIWYYGGMPNFPMPYDKLAALGKSFSEAPGVHLDAHMVWTWDSGRISRNGAMVEDDGSVIPDECRHLGFPITRTPSIVVLEDPAEDDDRLSRGWTRPENAHLMDSLGRLAHEFHPGWGFRHYGPR